MGLLAGGTALISGLLGAWPAALQARLSLEIPPGGLPALMHNGQPVLAYGPSPQNILTYLPSGDGNDYQDWAEWARQHTIRNVRSYPPSIAVDPPAVNLFERSPGQPDRFDLTRFNDAYFLLLRQACRRFADEGIIVHLQLWQAVYWKKRWDQHYYNPSNNVNPEISRNAGPGEFSTTANPHLLAHQIAYVRRILEATADAGNVYYDIMNEIGNGTAADPAWVEAILAAIGDWERESGLDVLVTLNDEGGSRLGDLSVTHPGLDLVVKDLGRYEQHVEAYGQSGKPTVSVRNIDFHYGRKERLYFFGPRNLEINTDADLQSRGRRYWWRMYMAGVVAAGAYADSAAPVDRSPFQRLAAELLAKVRKEQRTAGPRQSVYRLNELAEKNYSLFRQFVDMTGHPVGMRASAGVVAAHPAAGSYCLQNERRAIIYLESPSGEAGHRYPSSQAKLKGLHLPDRSYDLLIFHPSTGERTTSRIELLNGEASTLLPPFTDDLALLIQ
jgi:hypothetical protein